MIDRAPPAGPVEDPLVEVVRILDAATDASVPLRAIGGLAVALRAPSVRTLFPDRTWHDIDLVGPAGRPDIATLLERLGYLPERRFNALNGAERLLFHDPAGRRLDVFIGALRMCHELHFEHRLAVDRHTLPLADLVLSKLQIVELTRRDRQDLLSLLADHELTEDDTGIGLARLEAVCGARWGWWRTAVGSLDDLARDIDAADEDRLGVALDRAAALRARLLVIRGSWRWRLRAVLGERVPWYDAPEEVR